MNGAIYERELKELLRLAGYNVTRSAGSHGIDLFAHDPHSGMGYHIEVKSSRRERIDPRKNEMAKTQYETLLRINQAARPYERAVYAARWKTGERDGRWEIFVPEDGRPVQLTRGCGQTLNDAFMLVKLTNEVVSFGDS